LKSISIESARKLLLQGGVVAIPTETVYGLAGWIYSEAGLKNIFSTKERPFFDPLIVHVDGIPNAKKLTSDWTEIHQLLAEKCWPGPLTLIAKKNDKVDSLITAGLDSVGLRCPRHSETLKLLSQIDGGLAAPSANKFGKTSPTTSTHVADEFKNEVPILEGGHCEIGIESTVVGIESENDSFTIKIFRPGFYTASMLNDLLKEKYPDLTVVYAESPVAPGQLKHHYMPKIPLIIVPTSFAWEKDHDQVEAQLGKRFSRPKIWVQPTEAALASRQLYQKLRQFDLEGHDIIITSKLPEHELEEWKGIWNRLEKAKTLAL
jgi:L-threonylcarbamoyladenylate synthase